MFIRKLDSSGKRSPPGNLAILRSSLVHKAIVLS